ncbi:DKNYY domain-containing protein [Aliikangiella sp. IMCC44359]|uniref:DKNYY domain-containing protein n=1 Tax=Aliikangiella sp. IMCC44359 TaxID=3459125 RepID=UPI00403ABE14
MQIAINIVITLVLLYWPAMLMMSPMMFAAPGFDNDKKGIVTTLLFMCYPIGVFLLLWGLGGNYFGMSGFKLAGICALINLLVFWFFGYFKLLFNLQKGITNSGYSVTDNQAYFSAKLIPGADSSSFKILEDETGLPARADYAADKNNLYYQGKLVEGASVENLQKQRVNSNDYWLNNTQVIYNGKIIPKANPQNFNGFEDHHSWTYTVNNDEYIVFSYGVALPSVDRKTFQPLSDFIAKDNQQIFYKEKQILAQADAATFELFDDHDFARDQTKVYYISADPPFEIEGVDPDSFEIFDRGYVRDSQNVYYVHQYERIEKLKVDAASFEVTDYDEATQSTARDINHYYYDNKVVGDR